MADEICKVKAEILKLYQTQKTEQHEQARLDVIYDDLKGEILQLGKRLQEAHEAKDDAATQLRETLQSFASELSAAEILRSRVAGWTEQCAKCISPVHGFETALAVKQSEYRSMAAESTELLLQLASQRTAHQEKAEEILELRRWIQKLRRDIPHLEGQKSAAVETKRTILEIISATEEEHEHLTQSLAQLKEEMTSTQAQITERKGQNELLEQQLTSLRVERNKMDLEMATLAQLRELADETLQLMHDTEEQDRHLDDLSERRDAREKECEMGRIETLELETAISELSREISEKKSSMAEVAEVNKSLEREIDVITKELETLTLEESQLTSQLETKRVELKAQMEEAEECRQIAMKNCEDLQMRFDSSLEKMKRKREERRMHDEMARTAMEAIQKKVDSYAQMVEGARRDKAETIRKNEEDLQREKEKTQQLAARSNLAEKERIKIRLEENLTSLRSRTKSIGIEIQQLNSAADVTEESRDKIDFEIQQLDDEISAVDDSLLRLALEAYVSAYC